LTRNETQQVKTEPEGKMVETSGKIDGYGKQLEKYHKTGFP